MEWTSFVNTSDSMFQLCAFFMVFNPFFWNLTAQGEYRLSLISSCVAGHKKVACFILAVIIFSLGLYRDWIFAEMIQRQAVVDTWPIEGCEYAGWALMAIGQTLNLGAFYRLGFFGVYLGDYFGIFVLDAPVTSFPYNVSNDPMYWGSAMTFMGEAIRKRSPAGILLTVLLAITYKIAIAFESKMLHELYAAKAKREKSQ